MAKSGGRGQGLGGTDYRDGFPASSPRKGLFELVAKVLVYSTTLLLHLQ